jgi:hypothetical protein
VCVCVCVGRGQLVHPSLLECVRNGLKQALCGLWLAGLVAHRHSHIALRIHQRYNRRFGHFVCTVPRGRGKEDGYGDTVEAFHERANNATLDVAAETLGFPAASLSRYTRFERYLPLRFLKAQEARVHGNTHDDVPLEPTMCIRLAIAMIIAVSRQPCAPDVDGG